MSCSQTPEEIYQELRIRIATAFEIQINKFLEDDKLHVITMDMFNHIFQLKTNNRIKDYEIIVSQLNDDMIFTSIKVEPNVSKEEQFTSNVLQAMQILMQSNLKENPGMKQEDFAFKLKINKKSVTIQLVEK
jgi:hypothetical protein